MSIARRRIEGKPKDEWPLVIRYTGRDGRRHTETIPSGLKKDAQRREREIATEKEKGIHVPKSQTENMAFLFKLWLDAYEGLVRRGSKAKGSFDNYERDVRLHLLPEFGGTLITRFEALDAQHFVDQMLHRHPFKQDGSGKRDLTKYYKVSRLRIITIPLKLALDFAVDHKLVGRNVLKDRPVRFPEAPHSTREEWMQFEDARAILKVCDQRQALGIKSDDNALLWRNTRLLILIMMFTGLRGAEACGVQWESIDLARRLLHVRHQRLRDGQLTERLKSRKAKRSIPINELLYEALIKHAPVEERRGQVLHGGRDQPMRTYVVIQTIIPKIMERAGLVKEDGTHKFTGHQLRHFAGSIWLDEDMPLHEVSRLLGHASIQTTKDIYIHEMEHDTRAADAIQRVGALISGRPMPAIASAQEPRMIEHRAETESADGVEWSVSDAVEAPAPVAPPAPPKSLEEFREWQRQRVLELWKANRSSYEIASELGITNVTVTRWIQEASGNLRRAVQMAAAYEKMTPEQREEKRRKNRERYQAGRKKFLESMSPDVAS